MAFATFVQYFLSSLLYPFTFVQVHPKLPSASLSSLECQGPANIVQNAPLYIWMQFVKLLILAFSRLCQKTICFAEYYGSNIYSALLVKHLLTQSNDVIEVQTENFWKLAAFLDAQGAFRRIYLFLQYLGEFASKLLVIIILRSYPEKQQIHTFVGHNGRHHFSWETVVTPQVSRTCSRNAHLVISRTIIWRENCCRIS